MSDTPTAPDEGSFRDYYLNDSGDDPCPWCDQHWSAPDPANGSRFLGHLDTCPYVAWLNSPETIRTRLKSISQKRQCPPVMPEDLYMAILETAVQQGPFQHWTFTLSSEQVQEYADSEHGTYMGHFFGIWPDGDPEDDQFHQHVGLWRGPDGIISAS